MNSMPLVHLWYYVKRQGLVQIAADYPLATRLVWILRLEAPAPGGSDASGGVAKINQLEPDPVGDRQTVERLPTKR
jgi:hypothetical protein